MNHKELQRNINKIQRVLLNSDHIYIQCRADVTHVSNGHFIFTLPTTYMWMFDKLPIVDPGDILHKEKGHEWSDGVIDLHQKIYDCISDYNFVWSRVLPMTYETTPLYGKESVSYRPVRNGDNGDITFISETYFRLFWWFFKKNPYVYSKACRNPIMIYDDMLERWTFSVMILPCAVNREQFLYEMNDVR